ncbi:MAG: glycosyltransferase family 9 protein [Pseudomonadota bacterium]|nr:glycosyltransferase family 9 protein [Pseudomonadota bacterium]
MDSGIKKILVVRNDKLGDFMLTWPALSYLKKNLPQTEITCLIDKEFWPLAEHCPFIDKFIVDQNVFTLKKIIQEERFDAAISFFSTFRIGYALKSANIPIRIAPATKLAQFFYNHKIKQSRSKSKKPEHEYNTDLIFEFLETFIRNELKEMDGAPYLILDSKKEIIKKEEFAQKYSLKPEKKIIFIHPGTGGSSKNIPIETYADICNGLRRFDDYNFIIHFSKKEKNIGDSLSKLLDDSVNFHLIEPTASIEELLYNINSCDVFCSGSTGPLHVAGALNKRTIAFYPIKQSSTHLRWQTINDFDKRIEFSDIGGDKKSISINTKKVLLEIQKFLNFS